MNLTHKDTYYVAVKLFLEHDGKLFIFKDRHGDWDLPGGRIRKDEFTTPLDAIIRRKMSEELGGAIEYSVGKPIVFMRHERREAMVQGNPTVRIFAVGYEGKLIGGTIRLSEEHTEMEWVDIGTFEPEKYFTGGWLAGVQEYLKIRRTQK